MADMSFHCSKCGQHILIDESAAGMKVQCPTCQQDLVVPGPLLKPLVVGPPPKMGQQQSRPVVAAPGTVSPTTSDQHSQHPMVPGAAGDNYRFKATREGFLKPEEIIVTLTSSEMRLHGTKILVGDIIIPRSSADECISVRKHPNSLRLKVNAPKTKSKIVLDVPATEGQALFAWSPPTKARKSGLGKENESPTRRSIDPFETFLSAQRTLALKPSDGSMPSGNCPGAPTRGDIPPAVVVSGSAIDPFATAETLGCELSGRVGSPLRVFSVTLIVSLIAPVLTIVGFIVGLALGGVTCVFWSWAHRWELVPASAVFGMPLFLAWIAACFGGGGAVFYGASAIQWMGKVRNKKVAFLLSTIITASCLLPVLVAPAALFDPKDMETARWFELVDRNSAPTTLLGRYENQAASFVVEFVKEEPGVFLRPHQVPKPSHARSLLVGKMNSLLAMFAIVFLALVGVAGGWHGVNTPFCEKCESYALGRPAAKRRVAQWFGMNLEMFSKAVRGCDLTYLKGLNQLGKDLARTDYPSRDSVVFMWHPFDHNNHGARQGKTGRENRCSSASILARGIQDRGVLNDSKSKRH